MVDVFGVHIRGIFLVNDAPSHQHPHTSGEHFPLNTETIRIPREEREKKHAFTQSATYCTVSFSVSLFVCTLESLYVTTCLPNLNKLSRIQWTVGNRRKIDSYFLLFERKNT